MLKHCQFYAYMECSYTNKECENFLVTHSLGVWYGNNNGIIFTKLKATIPLKKKGGGGC